MSSGFVYVLTNEAMPGVVKIGKSIRHPRERSKELDTTGVPVPFDLVFAIYVDDVDAFERQVHDELSLFRVRDNREFFHRSAKDAIVEITDMFLMHMSHSAVPYPHSIDPGRLAWFANVADVPEDEVVDLLEFISDEEWRALQSRYHARYPERKPGQAASDRPRIESKPDDAVTELAGKLRVGV